jgi:hypothetical protein
MAGEMHLFTAIVGVSSGFGVPLNPNAWEVRDLTSGEVMAAGVAISPAAASTAATTALTTARANEKTRLTADKNRTAAEIAALPS